MYNNDITMQAIWVIVVNLFLCRIKCTNMVQGLALALYACIAKDALQFPSLWEFSSLGLSMQ